MSSRHHDTVPLWSWLFPSLAALLLAAKFGGIVSPDAAPAQLVAAILLFGAVFAAVHHAEVVALRLGEPFGSILLAVAVTVIEVGLIVSILLSGVAGTEAVARDTVFSAVMIVLNGVVGLCLVLGASQHREQSFQLQGASAALAVLAPLAVLALVLPDYTVHATGPYYSPVQLVFVAILSLVLYATFVFVQTIRHRDYFLGVAAEELVPLPDEGGRPSGRVVAASTVFLFVALAAVVLLAKLLSHPLEDAIALTGLPRTFIGIVIALLVLLPEGLASARAAIANRLQNSLNLALGSAIASIGLTIPVVAVVSLLSGQPLMLGLGSENSVLLLLTLFITGLTLGTGTTTVLQGVVHLVIFAVFLLLSAEP
jgi:Ca2+:H+ antiporter